MDEDKVTLESPVRSTTYFIFCHIKKFTFCLNVAFVFLVWFSQQAAIISLNSNPLDFEVCLKSYPCTTLKLWEELKTGEECRRHKLSAQELRLLLE